MFLFNLHAASNILTNNKPKSNESAVIKQNVHSARFPVTIIRKQI